MQKLIFAGVAALAFAIPASAQDAVVATDAAGNVYVLTDAQKVLYDGWPADRRAAYDAWPNDVKAYYWTLEPAQVDGWWVLNDEQRTQIYAMTPEQRIAAWNSIATQMSAATPAASASATADVATTAAPASGQPQFVSSAVVQTTAAAATPAGGEYPPCKGDQQDGCVNPREAGLNYGNRPLDHWPGKPASEGGAKKPAE